MTAAGVLLLAGGGHSHALVLKRWAMRPEERPKHSITLINRTSTGLYSGMVPGLIAGLYQRCLLYTSPSPRDKRQSRMPSSA